MHQFEFNILFTLHICLVGVHVIIPILQVRKLKFRSLVSYTRSQSKWKNQDLSLGDLTPVPSLYPLCTLLPSPLLNSSIYVVVEAAF